MLKYIYSKILKMGGLTVANKIKKLNIAIIFLIFILSTVLSGCTFLNPFAGNRNDEFIFSGTAEADEINITSEIAGRLKDIKVQEGQRIDAGTIIASIDSPESLIKLQQSEISLKSAQNDLSKINEGSRAEEIKVQQAMVSQAEAAAKQGEALVKQAKSNLDIAQANYDYKLKIYNDTKTLYDSGFESQSALDSIKNAVDNAKSVRDNASYALDSAKAQLDSFKAQLNAAKQKLNILVNGATERDKNTVQYGVDLANKNYELSKLAFNKSNITAVSGGVIESINYKQGEYVTPGNPIATLLDIQNMYVKIYVPEKMLPQINLGKEVAIKSDFLKDKTIKGKITYISPEAEFTPMNIITKKDREKLVFAVKVKILDNTESIKPGMLLDVNIQ